MNNGSLDEECRPSVRGEIKKARNSNYDFKSAIYEFVDNALDTGCETVRVEIRERRENGMRRINKIIISDDGREGISVEKMQKIFSWTYERERTGTDIGEYGTGFKSASVNLGHRLTVLSRHEENYLQAVADWDEMESKNCWRPKMLKIQEDFYKDDHCFEWGSSFIMDNLRYEFFQQQRNQFLMVENLLQNLIYNYKYFLKRYPGRKIIVRGLFRENDIEEIELSMHYPDLFFFYFDISDRQMESKIYVYRDQANFYNFFIQRHNSSKTEMVEFLEKRKNGNSHLRCSEVSNRILVSMVLVDCLTFRSCSYYLQEDQESETHTELMVSGNVDIILQDRIVGRDVSFRCPRNDAMADFIKHEVLFTRKSINPLMGVQFNKKTDGCHLDNDLRYSLEFIQMFHERDLIRLENRTCGITPCTSTTSTTASETYEQTPLPVFKEEDVNHPSKPFPISIPTSSSFTHVPVLIVQEEQEEEDKSATNTDITMVTPQPAPQESLPPSRRRNFTLETKLEVIKKQECRDSDFDFRLRDDILPLDYDHKNGRGNNSQDNCQALSVISHAIKTRKPELYREHLKKKEEYILELLNCLTSSQYFLQLFTQQKIKIKTLDDPTLKNGIFGIRQENN